MNCDIYAKNVLSKMFASKRFRADIIDYLKELQAAVEERVQIGFAFPLDSDGRQDPGTMERWESWSHAVDGLEDRHQILDTVLFTTAAAPAWLVGRRIDGSEQFFEVTVAHAMSRYMQVCPIFARLIQERVRDKVGTPPVVTAQDVVEAVAVVMAAPGGERDGRWAYVVSYLLNLIENGSRSESTSGSASVGCSFLAPSDHGYTMDQVLVTLGERCTMYIKSQAEASPDFLHEYSVEIWAHATIRALEGLRENYLRPAVQLIGGVVPVANTLFVSEVNKGRYSGGDDLRSGVVGFSRKRADWVADRLVAVLTDRSDIHSKPRSVAGAMWLPLKFLSEADRQQSDALKLSIAFASIESMLCDARDGISEQLARRISVMLCPDSDDRQGVYKSVKRLYNIRSKVLHGTTLDSFEFDAERAIRLGRVLVIAILEWDETARRLGVSASAGMQVFYGQLDEAMHSGKRLVGISDEVVTWGKNVLGIGLY